MSVKPITIRKFDGGLNLSSTSEIGDNQFSVCKNMFYNSKKQLQTRYGIQYFGNAIGSNKPVSSYFFYQRDDTLATMALCVSGTNMYKYNEGTGNWTSIKSGLSEYEILTGRTTWRTRRDFAVYKNVVYLANGVNNYASYNGTTYAEYATQPKYRYINQLTDRLFGTGDDTNPSTLYYTNAAPSDGAIVNTSSLVVGGDEMGRINGMNELGNIILALKSGKIYSIDVTNQKADAIDSQTGGYSDRTIANINNSIVYLTDRGFDTLKPRTGVAGGSSLESDQLDTDISDLTTSIQEVNLNANVGMFVKRLSNYYAIIDVTADDVPDTTVVYNSDVKARTTYSYPALYDLGMYITSAGVVQYIATSATEDRLYEIESGFDDLGEKIDHEIKSKNFDFGSPGAFKTYEYIDIIGKKSKGFDIEVNIEVDGENVGGGLITDATITETIPNESLGNRPIGIDTLTGARSTETVELYQYICRVPLRVTGSNINFQMKSTGGTRTIDSARIGVDQQEIDVFGYANII